MATGYSIPATDAMSMLGDAHSTNWAENREFFLNQNPDLLFELLLGQVWKSLQYLSGFPLCNIRYRCCEFLP